MRRFIRNISCAVLISALFILPVSAADELQDTAVREEDASIVTVTDEVDVGVTTAEETTSEIIEEVTDAAEVTTTSAAEYTTGDRAEPMTEEEMREAILRVAEAIGAYEEDIPAAGKAKQWIIDNLASLVGALMALSLLIATPVGRNVFKKFLTVCKNTLATVKDWKTELEGTIVNNGEKNAELRSAVNELMAKMTRENQDAIRRAEEAEQRATEYEEKLIQTQKDTATALDKCSRVNEAVCRAALVMAKPLEMSVQHSKAFDEMQRHEIFEEYREAVDTVTALLQENGEEVEHIAD